MEVFLQLGELRRMMRAHLQQVMDDVLATQNTAQFNALLNTAVLKTLQDCRWYSNNRRTTVDVGIGQYKVGYPNGTTAASISAAAILDPSDDLSSGYVPLMKRIIPVEDDVDQAEAAGGSTFTAVQGTPWRFEPRNDFIYLDPAPDRAFKLRLDFQTRSTLVEDEDVTVCDGQMVLYWALAMACAGNGDRAQQETWQGMYADRMGQLKALQSTNQVVPLSREADFDERSRYFNRYGVLPNWDTRPTIR